MRRKRCKAAVYKRDQYRISRGRGFRMHYNQEQCSRAAVADDLCKQHLRVAGVLKLDWHEFMDRPNDTEEARRADR